MHSFEGTHQQTQEHIFQTKISNFWIIDLESDSVFGPLTKDKYFDTRLRLKISNNLVLNNSTLHFYLHDQRQDVEYKNPDPMVVDIANLKGNKTGKD